MLPQLDLFPPASRGSLAGGAASLACLVVALLSCYSLLARRLSLHYSLTVDVSGSRTTPLPVHLDLYLLHRQCRMIQLAWLDVLTSTPQPFSVQDLIFTDQREDGSRMTPEMVSNADFREVGCRVTGRFEVPLV
jgi:hypothetical protein